jgi:alginate O-acetyltransferase complex protein AlgI
MLLGGLWHGASWNFVVWGGLHGFYLVAERIFRGEARAAPANWARVRAWLKAAWIFVLVSVTWIFFRSPSMDIAVAVWRKLLLVDPQGITWLFVPALLAVPVLVVGGFLARRWEWRFPLVAPWSPLLPAVLVLGALLVFLFAALDSSPFIYFQF